LVANKAYHQKQKRQFPARQESKHTESAISLEVLTMSLFFYVESTRRIAALIECNLHVALPFFLSNTRRKNKINSDPFFLLLLQDPRMKVPSNLSTYVARTKSNPISFLFFNLVAIGLGSTANMLDS
jgi:hypothetical protein